jgi:hypothetical protein
MAAGDITTAAGHVLRGLAKKGVRRRWGCERCHAPIVISLALSFEDATAELKRQVELHGGPSCP